MENRPFLSGGKFRRRSPTRQESLQERQLQSNLPAPGWSSSKRGFPSTKPSNPPLKRQRFLDADDGHQRRSDEQQELNLAPDWGGNETTEPAPSPGKRAFGPPTSSAMAPPPPTPAAYRDTTNLLSLAHEKWGLRQEVVSGFAACGIEEMYPWQSDCLSIPGLLTGEANVVYTAPTSAGKSLVADVLMIRKVVAQRKKAIIVLPYIAIVQEKTRFLKKVLGNMRVPVPRRGKWDKMRSWTPVNIVGFHHGAKSRIGWGELDIAICTIEKANILVNAAIEDRTIDRLGIVVFDELHMLDEDSRGYILELLATKLLCLTEQSIQIVGMSATLSNVKTLASWLQAEFYECTYRPVPLQEHLVFDNGVYTYDEELKARIPPGEIKALKDPVTNAMVVLAFGAVAEGHGVLVFCESRRKCEELSRLLVRFMPDADDETVEKRMDVVRDLATTPTGLDFTLERTVSSGVAFHHAGAPSAVDIRCGSGELISETLLGLTTEERDLVASAYDRGLIKVICCTATMAAGVNLPARRVIISPKMGISFLKPAMLKQMRGRAGRKGKDTFGESYLCCCKEDLAPVKELLSAGMPSVKSCLGKENQGLKRALLEGIVTKLATSTESLSDYIHATLLWHTTPDPLTALRPIIFEAIDSLKDMNLITEDRENGYFEATKTGSATVTSGLGPEEGVFLHGELSRALMNFNLESDMHIVYQFTPIHSSTTQGVRVDWKLLREEMGKLDESSLRAAAFVGVNPVFVNRMAQGGVLREDSPANIEKARVYRRFYVSVMLRELINEKPVHVVATNYDVARGFIQQLATTCKGFATTSATFCKVMGWTGLAVLLEHYSWRLDLGVKEDLIELARIPFVKSFTARIFHENGLKTVAAVAAAELKQLVEVLQKAQPKKLRLKGEEEGKIKKRLEERAAIILDAAQNIHEQDCMAEIDY